jgi:hypothetical protein
MEPDENRERFRFLAHFLSSEFVQDSEDRRSIEEVVADFRSTNNPDVISGTRRDIGEFLHRHGNDLESAFDSLFLPQVDPRGYGMTTADWLLKIEKLLGPS